MADNPERQRWGQIRGPVWSNGESVDVCVIGSGAGGAPVALTLARAGFRVVVLEKGPYYDERDFFRDEIRSCRRDFFVPSTADEPHVRLDETGKPRLTTDGWTANCVGGATVHFSGFTYRLHAEDFKLRSLWGSISGANLADWPIDYAQLLPYYERAESELGVSGDATKIPYEQHRKNFLLPPLPENGFSKLIDDACARKKIRAYPTPRAILSQASAGRGPCRRTHFCGSYGCERGAKSSTLAALWPKALQTGKCQIRPLSMATRIETNDAGDATAVHYIDAMGKLAQVNARIVVVACSAVETPRLLLMSDGKKHPQGIGNHSGQLGRNLMFTGFGAGEAEFLRSDSRIAAIDFNEPFVNRSVQDYYWFRPDGKRTSIKGGTIGFLLAHGNPIFAAEQLATAGRDTPLWGTALKDALRRRFREVRVLEYEVFSETLPMFASQISLDPSVKDRFGLPVARLNVAAHPLDAERCRMLVEKGHDILVAMKPATAKIKRWGDQTTWLQAGTCRFGSDADHSVLNADCRVHSAKNVFVTDGSFMPTSGAVPNTLTILANAFRVADRIVALGRAHEI